MLWACTYLEMECPERNPAVALATRCEIARLYDPHVDCVASVNVAAAAFNGFYIILRKEVNWDSPSLRDKAILLHEIVHYIQSKNGIYEKDNVPCLELQAYWTELMWSFQQGVDNPEKYRRIPKGLLDSLYRSCYGQMVGRDQEPLQ